MRIIMCTRADLLLIKGCGGGASGHAILSARAKKGIDIYEPELLVAVRALVCVCGMVNPIVGGD